MRSGRIPLVALSDVAVTPPPERSIHTPITNSK